MWLKFVQSCSSKCRKKTEQASQATDRHTHTHAYKERNRSSMSNRTRRFCQKRLKYLRDSCMILLIHLFIFRSSLAFSLSLSIHGTVAPHSFVVDHKSSKDHEDGHMMTMMTAPSLQRSKREETEIRNCCCHGWWLMPQINLKLKIYIPSYTKTNKHACMHEYTLLKEYTKHTYRHT